MAAPKTRPESKSKRHRRLPSAACSAFYAALRRMLDRGQTRISANCLASEMWPDARHNNAHGQTFNLAAGVAGRMLRKHRGCWEVENRVWEIVPEFIPQNSNSRDPRQHNQPS